MAKRRSAAGATRSKLLDELRLAVRDNSTAAVMLHSAIGERMGLSVIEEKTLGILQQHGPLPAGAIATHTGLAAASVTSLVDRLETKGFVRRTRGETDRRVVLVEIDQEKLAAFAPIFDALGGLLDEILEPYSLEQLETILDFLHRASARSAERIATLAG